MGWGDELMVTGQARVMQERDPRKVRIVYERRRWHEAFDHNPRIARPEEQGDFQVLEPRRDWLRPYCVQKRVDRWIWRKYEPPAGELYFTEAELDFGERHAGRVIVQPHLKAGASPNKQWGWINWNKLAWLAREKLGVTVTQIGSGTVPVIDGAEHIGTAGMRLAAAMIARARAVVASEGGLHHVAAAVGTPAVVIYGGYISPAVTGYPEQKAFFGTSAKYPLGCGNRQECDHCRQAMASISPEAVFEALREILERRSDVPAPGDVAAGRGGSLPRMDDEERRDRGGTRHLPDQEMARVPAVDQGVADRG